MTDMRPDILEEELAEQLDNVVPSHGYDMTPLVALGGSAGAIQALQTFFENVPAKSGIAYVVVLHLAPEHESLLPEILQRHTSMTVLQVHETCKVEPDTVYVIPPGKALRSVDGHIRVVDFDQPAGRRVTVDIFFRGLADTHGPHAGAVVLSGGDGDGAIGLKRVKERGGLTISQDPAEAEHPSMPNAAVATAMVDWILPVAEMPQRITDYFAIEKRLRLPDEHGPQPVVSPHSLDADETRLREVLAFLRARTGRDFSYYKRATIVRRIARRMQVNDVRDLGGYLDCLRMRSGEAGALLQDLLISVTNFFRDSEAFEAMAREIPTLFEGKRPHEVVRVWVAACATGEEAYSLAMLLIEHARQHDAPPVLQVFATDLDDSAVQAAREGRYPSAIEGDVSPERLRRFFVKDREGYRVRRELREMVLFATHDLLRDSPFSRLDLVSCRNLLIYLDPAAQRRAFEVMRFALVPNGRLFLGTSESVESGNPHFSVLDKKHRLFVRRDTAAGGIPLPSGPSSLAMALDAERALRDPPVVPGRSFQQVSLVQERNVRPVLARGTSWGDIHLKLLEHLAAPSLLVDSQDDIVHMSPNAGRFVQQPAGEPTRNLLRMVAPALRIELRTTLHQATQHGVEAMSAPALVPVDGALQPVTVRVVPIRDGLLEVRLVLFELPPAGADAPAAQRTMRDTSDPVVQQLDRELERLRLHLQETVEQYENSTQDLKASNEELQAINEELRSASEELETSREELQSINEELTTVNHELKLKVDELAHANSDMQNLMNATAIATIFLDRDLNITRYTPSAVRLFNLIPGDVGRPLTDLAPQLQYPQLADDSARVLEDLVPVEREVGREDGSWFLARMLPYRTTEDRIAGVVVSFINITERKHAEDVSQWLSAVVASSIDAIVSFSLDGRILSWNGGAERMFGYAVDEAIGKPISMLAISDEQFRELRLFERLAANQSIEALETEHRDKDGNRVHLSLSVSPIVDVHGRVIGATASARDIGEALRGREAVRRSEENLRLLVENARDYAIFTTDTDRRITSWNRGSEYLLGYAEAEVMGRPADIIFTEEDQAAGAPLHEASTAIANERAADERYHMRKNGSRFWGSGVLMRMQDDSGKVVGFVKILRDQTQARETRQALERSQSELLEVLQKNEQARTELQAADVAKDRFIAMLSHELRNPLASVASAAALLVNESMPQAQRRQAAQIVERQARSMKLLVDDLLDVSRLAVGQLELRRSLVAVAALLDAAVETALPAIETAGHFFRVQVPEVPLYVQVDLMRASQALVNVLGNAARYTPRGGEILLTARPENGQVLIVVVDNGQGMQPGTIERMFDLYAQGPGRPERTNEGLGVGLTLVRDIVQQHGGSVQAFSEGVGLGSRFEIRLPLADSPDDADLHGDGAAATAPIARLRVLIADDNVDAAWALGQLLQLAGHHASTAQNGEEALLLAEKDRPDVAILDIGMPGLSGFEVARRLRAAPWAEHMAIVALSGWGEPGRDEPAETHFDARLMKPALLPDVLAAMERVVNDRRSL